MLQVRASTFAANWKLFVCAACKCASKQHVLQVDACVWCACAAAAVLSWQVDIYFSWTRNMNNFTQICVQNERKNTGIYFK